MSKRVSMTTDSRIAYRDARKPAWCKSGTVIGRNMQRSPASGVLAAVARERQGLEPRSVGIDEETFNLDFVTEEQRLTGPTSMRFSMVKKLTLRKQRESIW